MIVFYPFFILFLFCLSLVGCMVGPNFHTPPSPSIDTYTAKLLPSKTVATPSIANAGKSQLLVKGADIPAEWWYLFKSPALNDLIKAGIANNANLAATYASLRLAQETLQAEIGNGLLPQLNGGILGQRQRSSNASANTTQTAGIYNLFNVSANVSYTLDIFGGTRREIESLYAQVDYQQFQLIAAYLTLSTNIVTAAVTIASLDAQIRATEALFKSQEAQLNILQKQFNLGAIAQEIILAQQTLVNQTRATLSPLEKNLSQSRHALAVLIGSLPNQLPPIIRLEAFYLPARLPISLPSYLVRQRPDVRASEALLHAATAKIGVATANLFPQFNITGNKGWEAAVASQLFTPGNKIWSIAGQITQPIFHGGALLAQRRQAIAAYDQASANYRQVVLQAFQNVADTLRALEADAKTLQAQKRAENSARESLVLTSKQYRLGGTSYLALLNAQQQYQITRLSRIQAQAARYIDTAVLFQALGGGWWHKTWCVKECLYVAE